MSRPSKRSRREEPGASSPATSEGRAGNSMHFPASPPQATRSVDLNFRSLSTCNRCRIRKHRCDQRLPTCANCEKVGAPCMGYDPVTKKEIPRSYVYHLETRVATLESILDQHRISYPPANASATSATSVSNTPRTEPQEEGGSTETEDKSNACPDTVDMIMGSMGTLPTQVPLGGGGPNSDACASSISFAHLAFSCVRSSVAASSDPCRGTVTQRSLLAGSNGDDHRAVAPGTSFPDRLLGLRLVHLYFHHSNPMYPILHRKDFRTLFDRACASQQCTAREWFLLYIVFAIGAGIHLTGDHSDWEDANVATKPPLPGSGGAGGEQGHRRQVQPEDYYATAITYLDSFLTSNTGRRRDNGCLEELQAVLLLAAFALLRPASPGLWYIVGSALRRAVDLGLYSDDQAVPKLKEDDADSEQTKMTRDLRRRLWWCAYSFDRLISTCAGRPCSVPDSVIATEFPLLLDDDFISPNGFDDSGEDLPDLSYKHVSHHYFRLRMLQSEISQVTQAIQAQRTREDHNRNRSRPHRARDPSLDLHGELRSPFLRDHASLKPWRDDVERRLQHWRETVPEESTSGVTFPTEYFDLNYWQTILMLYSCRRQTAASTPSTALDDHHPAPPAEASWTSDGMAADESEQMFLRIAEAGQAVLRLYRELHLRNLVNYTYLDTHQLFTAANAFLSAVWLSATVRQRFTVEDVDLTVLAATSVLNDLVEKCPHSAACRDAIQKISKATLKRCRLSRKGMSSSSSSRRRLLPPRARDTLLASYSFSDGPRSASLHGTEDGRPSRTTDAVSSASGGLLSISGSADGNRIGSNMHSSRLPDACLADEPIISSGGPPPHFADDHHDQSATAPQPSMHLPELDHSSGDIATGLDYQHHDPNAASNNFLNVSWNDDYLSFDPTAPVGLFDSFFFGDMAADL